MSISTKTNNTPTKPPASRDRAYRAVRLDKAMLRAAKTFGPSKEQLAWLKTKTVAQMVRHRPFIVVWCMRVPAFPALLTDAQLSLVAKLSPTIVLQFAAPRLSPESFTAIAARFPDLALLYAADLLSPEQADEFRRLLAANKAALLKAASIPPAAALEYCK